MHFRDLRFCASLTVASTLLCIHPASAQSPLRPPASLLVFAEFDSTAGHDTILTVTNTNSDTSVLPNGQMAGTIDVEFVFINGDNCLEFNRTHRLTPNDTVSALASFFNPIFQRGYCFAFAKQPGIGQPISFNWLTGTSTMLFGTAGDYTVEPFSFRAIGAQGTLTDLNRNGRRDLDGAEYEPCPDRIIIPRFHGQAALITQSHLVLLNLTGAVQFDALVNITSFNDNENVFASQHVFECWMKEPLSSLGGVFNNAFLQGLDDPTEPLGAPGIENGWFFIDGLSASSSACSTADPAILGLLIEGIGASRSATLPFASVETQTNGSLVEFSILTPGCEQFVANNDSFNMCANPSTAEAIDILINDVGSIDCESITITDNPDHGLISVLADCGLPFCPLTCLGYQPAPGFVGEDTFTYQVTSAVNPGITDQATVTIRVRQVVANNDTATTIQGTPIIIGVTANDSASPPLTLDCSSLVILVPPSNGTVQPVACGGLPGPCPAACVRYTPNANFTGTDSFVYGIGAGECTDTATVALTVLPAAPPKASQR